MIRLLMDVINQRINYGFDSSIIDDSRNYPDNNISEISSIRVKVVDGVIFAVEVGLLVKVSVLRGEAARLRVILTRPDDATSIRRI